MKLIYVTNLICKEKLKYKEIFKKNLGYLFKILIKGIFKILYARVV